MALVEVPTARRSIGGSDEEFFAGRLPVVADAGRRADRQGGDRPLAEHLHDFRPEKLWLARALDPAAELPGRLLLRAGE